MNKQDWYNEEKNVYKKFEDSLNKINIMPRAQLLIREAPPENAPGRKYYTHFDFFLERFDIPDSLSDNEIILYKNFIKRLDKTGQLKSGEEERIINKLNNAISNGSL